MSETEDLQEKLTQCETNVQRQLSQIQDLQEEIRLLKEREASLQRQLMLERERRLHAEKIIENEKNACLELKSLLEQQDKKFRATFALPPTQLSNYCARDSEFCICHVT